jgi:hypothetical protein
MKKSHFFWLQKLTCKREIKVKTKNDDARNYYYYYYYYKTYLCEIQA